MIDAPGPILDMLVHERHATLLKGHQQQAATPGQPQRDQVPRLHNGLVRRTIGLTLIRTGTRLAGAQTNGA